MFTPLISLFRVCSECVVWACISHHTRGGQKTAQSNQFSSSLMSVLGKELGPLTGAFYQLSLLLSPTLLFETQSLTDLELLP